MADENYEWDEGGVEDCPASVISFGLDFCFEGGMGGEGRLRTNAYKNTSEPHYSPLTSSYTPDALPELHEQTQYNQG